MTTEEHHHLGVYARCLADLMGLRDWTIYIDIGPVEDSEYQAAIERIYGRKHARIRVAETWHEQSPEGQRQSLAHELVHLHMGGVQDAISALAVAPNHNPRTYAVWRLLLDHQMEFAVDALADAVAQGLPLPHEIEVGEAA